jgi:hypothetical protein
MDNFMPKLIGYLDHISLCLRCTTILKLECFGSKFFGKQLIDGVIVVITMVDQNGSMPLQMTK